MSLSELTAREIRTLVGKKEVSAREVVLHFLDRIEARNGELNAFVHVDREGALAAADESDARLAEGEAPRWLEGVPVGLKDNLTARKMPTTCASRVLEGWEPPYDAEVVLRIRRAGGIVLGKLNMDEFAMGSSNESSAFGPVKNPWDPSSVPGGSSGGSAAAVAAGLSPLALGSDTGGSIRQPAAFCGVTGMKPTYGRVSRRGLVAFASSLDQIGPLARDAESAALLYTAIAGLDDGDATSLPGDIPSADRPLDLSGLTVATIREQWEEGLDGEVILAVREALDALKEAGATVTEVSLPHTPYGIAAYYLVANSEASSNLARYDGVQYGRRRSSESGDLLDMITTTRAEGFGPEVKRRIMLGTFALSTGYSEKYYNRALRVRRRIADDFETAFRDVDLVVGPTTPTPAFRLGEKVDDPLSMYLSDVLTVPVNLAGLPAVSVPAGFSKSGLPIGLHIVGPASKDHRVLGAAMAFQRLTDWHRRRPPEPGRSESR